MKGGRLESCMNRGAAAAQIFTSEMQKRYNCTIKPATLKEDIEDHVDLYLWGDIFEYTGQIRIDFKAIKSVSSYIDEGFGDYPEDAYNIIEHTNVRGFLGWLYGAADYIVFETLDSWLWVPREDLLEFTDGKVDWQARAYPADHPFAKMCTPASYLKGFQRPNRKDLITVVKKEDLLKLSTLTELK